MCRKMEEHRAKLNAIFKTKVVQADDQEDDNTAGEYWEFQNPDHVDYWSLALVPLTDKIHFVHKFRNAPTFLQISPDERVTDIRMGEAGVVEICCVTTGANPYMFTICVDISVCPFRITEFLLSL